MTHTPQRSLNDKALMSLAQDAADAATVTRTGDLSFPAPIQSELDSLTPGECLTVLRHVSVDDRFRSNCGRMGLDPDTVGFAPAYAAHRAKVANRRRTLDHTAWALVAALSLALLTQYLAGAYFPEAKPVEAAASPSAGIALNSR